MITLAKCCESHLKHGGTGGITENVRLDRLLLTLELFDKAL